LSNLRSAGCNFDSQSGCYQVVNSNCLNDKNHLKAVYNQLTKHQGQLSLLSLQGRQIKYQLA